MFTITYTFVGGSQNTMKTEDYATATKWWNLFSNTEIMMDIGIEEMILTDSKGQVVAAKCGTMKIAA